MESWIFKQDFLNTTDKTQASGFYYFTKLSHKADILHQLIIFATFQIIQQLIHDDEVSLLAIFFSESRHHCHECIFVICNVADIGEFIGNAASSQILLDVTRDDGT